MGGCLKAVVLVENVVEEAVCVLAGVVLAVGGGGDVLSCGGGNGDGGGVCEGEGLGLVAGGCGVGRVLGARGGGVVLGCSVCGHFGFEGFVGGGVFGEGGLVV